MGTINTPNITVPLASSYNERGVDGFTNSITNSLDQYKKNCIYEITKNSTTGTTSFNLVKRPGILQDSATYGSTAQGAYQIQGANGSSNSNVQWLYSKLGNDIRVSDSATTTTIFSSGTAFIPCYVDKTSLSGSDTSIVQARVNNDTAQRVFFNTSSIGAAWSEITDGDFTGIVHRGKMEFMDGFAFVLDSTNKIYNSDLNSLSSWNPVNFITKQITQDAASGLAKCRNFILAFGPETVEVFYNAGLSSGSPLSPVKQLHTKIGCLIGNISGGASNYYATIKNNIYFIGHTIQGAGFSHGLFMFDGSNFNKVSPQAIDKIISSRAVNIFSVYAFGMVGKSFIAIAMDGPGTFPHRSLIYSPDWNEWFEWNSAVFTTVTNGKSFIGTPTNKLYNFGDSAVSDTWSDNGTNYQFATQFSLPNNGSALKRMPMFGVIGSTSSAGAANTILVEFSDDDYQSFKTAGTISLSSDNKTLKRGGAYRNRAVRLSNTNAAETRLQSFIALVK